VLRTRSPVRALNAADRDEALALCGRNLAANVFVAARIEEGALDRSPGSILGYREGGDLHSLCWVSANVVPVETTVDSRSLFADRVRRWRAHCASLLGPQDEVLDLWKQLERSWGPERVIRASQPLMSSRTRPSALGLPLDPRVRRARLDEVDLILPAAAHMFAAEIGYPPYTGSSRAYRSVLSGLVRRGHTYVVVEGGRVVFKADVGSVSGGCAQVQGVWLAPDLRGQGLSVAMMAAVVEQVMADIAPWVTLYVNDFNLPARATYARVGFEDIGMFTTVLL
jgi:predicted GNAT family acetyltransferase